MSITRVVIADDHPIILTGLSLLIKADASLELVGQAVSGPEAVHVIRDCRPDIAIVDLSLPEIDGIQVIRELSAECRGTGFIALTQHEDRAYFNQTIDAGARGYVLKRSTAIHLASAIRGVNVGGLYVDPAMAAYLFKPSNRPCRQLDAGMHSLTDRESEVLKLVASGLTSKQIASRLDISSSSVETYKMRASQKVSVRSRAEIVRYASAQGWLAAI